MGFASCEAGGDPTSPPASVPGPLQTLETAVRHLGQTACCGQQVRDQDSEGLTCPNTWVALALVSHLGEALYDMFSSCNPCPLSPCVHNPRGIAKMKYILVFHCVFQSFDMFCDVSVGVCEPLDLVVMDSMPLLTHPLWKDRCQYLLQIKCA